MNETRLKIYPEIGDAYTVTVNVPENVSDIEEWIDSWMDDNLKLVQNYEILG